MPSILLPKQPVRLPAAVNTPASSRTNGGPVSQMAESIIRDVLAIPEATVLAEPLAAKIGNTTDYVLAATCTGIPVRNARITITVGELNGTVIAVRNSIPAYEAATTTPSISSADATAAAKESVTGFTSSSDPTIEYVRNDQLKSLELCYAIRGTDAEHMSWRITVDATTGRVVEKKQLAHFFGDGDAVPTAQTATVQGKVHLHVPTDTLTTVPMSFVQLTAGATVINADSLGRFIAPTNGTLKVTLRNAFTAVTNNASGSASALLNATLPLAAQTVNFDDNNSDVAERDAYHSVNAAHSFMRKLDTALHRIDQFLAVNVNYNSACNAFYDPPTVSLTFFSAGSGCVNTAEIADVVQHEFGHRCQHAVFSSVYGGDSDIVNSSLGEGFADLYTAFMRDDPNIGIGFQGPTTELRTCNNTLKWPKDLSIDPHANGSIIAGAFWDLRKALGLDTTAHLYERMMWHTPDADDIFSDQYLLEAFVNTLIATLIADDNDNNLQNGTPHTPQILTAFAKHKISLSGLISLDVPHLPDQDTGAFPYPVAIDAGYSGPIGTIDTTSLTLYYSTDRGKTYSHMSFAAHDSAFLSLIPPQPAGTVVSYYVSAKLTFGNDSVIAPATPYSFLVGYHTLASDDCEQNHGWTVGVPADAATTGLWELAKPFGTYQLPTPPIFFIQQDTDHSPLGTKCYITGNKNVGQGDGRNPSLDDVDNGATTLITPNFSFDTLIDPVFRYWYYYTNDQGSNPGSANWVVKVSFDSGAHWKSVVSTNVSTDGWTPAAIRLADYGSPSKQVQIEFIASDYLGSLVEAGIDDIELLDVVRPSPAAVKPPTSVATSVFPNPVAIGRYLRVSGSIRSLELVDLQGRTIAASATTGIVIPQSAASGVYSLKVVGTDGSVTVHSVVVTQ